MLWSILTILGYTALLWLGCLGVCLVGMFFEWLNKPDYWREEMDRLLDEYFADDALADHAAVTFDVWYHEKYCTKKQPEGQMPQTSVYR